MLARISVSVLLGLSPLALQASQPALAVAKVVSYHDDHMYVVEKTLTDGSMTIEIAHVMPSSEEGTHTHVHGDAALLEPGGPGCDIGGANAWNNLCGINRVHWSGTHPVVYFIDHTGSAWPVYESVVKWNESTALDVGYRYGYNTCPSPTSHCVNVNEGYYTPDVKCGSVSDWVGCTYLTANSSHVITQVYINMNNRFSGSYAHNRVATCHEEGHALGLGHNWFTDSCLYPVVQSPYPQYPNSNDYAMLLDIY
jgi:hypothetical protein